MAKLEEIAQAVEAGDHNKAKELTQQALDQGIDYQEIMRKGLIAGMNVLGEQFGKGEVYVPEVVMAARAMKTAMELILPILSSSEYDYVAKVAIGSVKGDLHDIGKNLVAAVFSGSGFEVVDLGIDVPPEKFVEAIEQGAQVIGMSALIGTTMPFMEKTIAAIEEAGLRNKVKIIVGGPLVTQKFADKIGADAYGADAFSGAGKVTDLLN